MAQFMLLVYQEEEVEAAVQAERERELPVLLEMHRSLPEAGLLVSVQRPHSVESATSVHMRDGETEITDGPFAVTKEVLAGVEATSRSPISLQRVAEADAPTADAVVRAELERRVGALR